MKDIEGQISLFDFIEDTKDGFCFDDDINEIVKELDRLTEQYNLKSEKNWTIWSHVPHFGYRLEYDISYRGKKPEKFYEDLNDIMSKAKKKNVELSAYDGCVEAIDGFYHMDVYSTFMDKERRKIK